jgi:AraC-like DNA-binding protein
MKIEAAMWLVGLKSRASFCRQFRKHWGQLPTECRRWALESHSTGHTNQDGELS